MTEHCLIPGNFFTPEQWRGAMARYISALIEKPGGVLLISVEVAPERRNYPEVRFAVFDAVERKALRAALLKAKKKREAVPSHTAPGRPRLVPPVALATLEKLWQGQWTPLRNRRPKNNG